MPNMAILGDFVLFRAKSPLQFAVFDVLLCGNENHDRNKLKL